MDVKNILQLYKEKLYKEFNLIPIFGCELEFYILFSLPKKDWYLELIHQGYDIIEERGFNQFEIRLKPTTDISMLCERINIAKKKITETLQKHNAQTLFTSKPFDNQPSSALHMHLNFMYKNADDNYSFVKELKFIIGGLLHTVADLMIFFAPNQDSYKRYTDKSMTTPYNISWGYNNRTTALRLLKDSEGNPRIEHRVSGSDASPLEVVAAILCGAYLGLREKILPIPPTYGLAFDPQYNLASLPTTLTEAKKNFTKSQFSDMFNPSICNRSQ